MSRDFLLKRLGRMNGCPVFEKQTSGKIMAYTTRKEMLEAVARGDDTAWNKFYEFYKPLVLLRARDMALKPHETEELCQNVLLAVFQKNVIGLYNAEAGKFRSYFRQVITNCAIDIIRSRPGKRTPVPQNIPDNEQSLFEDEWREFVLDKAKAEVRQNCSPDTYMAYELYAERGLPIGEVAKMLKMSESQIYQAKTRTLKRIQAAVQRFSHEQDG